MVAKKPDQKVKASNKKQLVPTQRKKVSAVPKVPKVVTEQNSVQKNRVEVPKKLREDTTEPKGTCWWKTQRAAIGLLIIGVAAIIGFTVSMLKLPL